jgi:CelD/BcsL family acetyltransferase involved in cellulose biosynthesis
VKNAMLPAKKRLITPFDENWDSFIDSTAGSGIFHHSAWIGMLTECYGYRSFVLAICDGYGNIHAGLPMMEVNSILTGRRWVSLPFSDHCKPLFQDDFYQRKLFEYLSELQVEFGVPHIEIRGEIHGGDHVYRNSEQVLHQLKLSNDPQEVFIGFHYQVRKKSISRAERDGVRVRWAENKDDLDTFYRLHLLTRSRLGVPIQPKRYFELLWKRIIDAKLGFILLAYMESLPIAGAVFLTFKNTLIYKYSASDMNYRRYRANHLLLWTAIRWGCEQRKTILDFGRTDVSDVGLCSFKRSWGTDEIPLIYSTMTYNPPSKKSGRLQDIMGTIIQKSPLWVCRATGELLYKHFA